MVLGYKLKLRKLQNRSLDKSEIGAYVNDARELSGGFQNCLFKHVSRTGAHSLATEGIKNGEQSYLRFGVPAYAKLVGGDRRWKEGRIWKESLSVVFPRRSTQKIPLLQSLFERTMDQSKVSTELEACSSPFKLSTPTILAQVTISKLLAQKALATMRVDIIALSVL
ncbi:hypothetical protein Gotur_022180 [Gossypium turneri]